MGFFLLHNSEAIVHDRADLATLLLNFLNDLNLRLGSLALEAYLHLEV